MIPTRYLDLTLALNEHSPCLPGDPETTFSWAFNLREHGARVRQISCSSHWGTHVDAPAHMLEKGAWLGSFSLDLLCGPACVIRLPGKAVIGPEDVPDTLSAPRVLLATSASDDYGSVEYWNAHPVLQETAVQKLLDAGMKLLGLDMCSPDRNPWPVHKMLFDANTPIIENLVGLERLPDCFELIVAPMALLNAEAAPARVIARI